MHISDPESGNPIMERQAFRFGAAFLMPAELFKVEFGGRTPDWTHLLEMKVRWEVSLAAMLYRARDLQLLTLLARIPASAISGYS